jgi:hypothetical protein
MLTDGDLAFFLAKEKGGRAARLSRALWGEREGALARREDPHA